MYKCVRTSETPPSQKMVKSFRGKSMASSVRSSQDDSAPDLNEETDFFAKVIESRGKGQFLVSLAGTEGAQVLAYMPPKFRNALWIRRGSFIIVRKFVQEDEQNKDSIEILHVLTAEQIKELKKNSTWPKEYDLNPITAAVFESEASAEEDDLSSENEEY
jgi:probable RNA-binding protein EIF1AD